LSKVGNNSPKVGDKNSPKRKKLVTKIPQRGKSWGQKFPKEAKVRDKKSQKLVRDKNSPKRQKFGTKNPKS